jgi:hypothetical protein
LEAAGDGLEIGNAQEIKVLEVARQFLLKHFVIDMLFAM